MNDNLYINKTTETFDVIVVGSGITGGWAAKEFCEKGLKTLMIERGRVVEHRKDYTTEGKGPWEFKNRLKVDNLLVEQQYAQQKKCYAFNDATKQYFGNDRDLPYSTAKDTDFTWIRANQLGGKSLLWHRQSYRFSEYDFKANKADGYGNDWPLRYADLAPWYSKVENHIGVSGNKDNLSELPNSESLPPFELTSPEKAFQQHIKANYPDRHLVIGRAAHLTEPSEFHISQSRGKCMTRNECQKGCSFGAYFSTQSSTLPSAVATNNLHIAPNSVVESLIYDEKTNRVKGVRVIDNNDLSQREYFANVVFLCASTLASTQIMLNSKSKRFPNGIANSSGVLGHYLMDHNYNARIYGDIEGYDDEYYSGRRPTGFYIPNFQFTPSRYNKNYIRGYAIAGGTSRKNWQSLSKMPGIGASFKQQLTQAGKWQMSMSVQGEMLPRFENHVALHPTKTDKWGMPQLEINCTWSENEKAMMDNAAEVGAQMMKDAGLVNVTSKTTYHYKAPGIAIHEVGTARMGRDPKNSVLNGFNQSHDIPNLFVSDGASFCSTATVNPSLTLMALTVRAVDYCIKEINNKRI